MSTRLALLFALLPLLACSLFTPETPPVDTHPADFSVLYEWYEGSMPPPYHYEYTLQVAADGAGTLTMIPDYPGEGVPVWTETFTVEPAALDALYRQLVEAGAFTTNWREEDDPPVGGSYATATLTADGETVAIPSFVIPNQGEAQDEIFAALEAVVPADIRADLEARRQQYMEEHGG